VTFRQAFQFFKAKIVMGRLTGVAEEFDLSPAQGIIAGEAELKLVAVFTLSLACRLVLACVFASA
jgi:hypothetical protein